MKRFVPLTRSSSLSYQPGEQKQKDALPQFDFCQDPEVDKEIDQLAGDA